MARRNGSIEAALLASSILAWPAMAADVTPERLLNPDREPQNWLMNHRHDRAPQTERGPTCQHAGSWPFLSPQYRFSIAENEMIVCDLAMHSR
jgi:hypothetical protein